jgi:hypothetical protein
VNCEDTQAANKEVPLGEKQTAKGDQASEESIVPQGVMVGGVELKRIQRSSLDQIPDRSDCVDIRQYGSRRLTLGFSDGAGDVELVRSAGSTSEA